MPRGKAILASAGSVESRVESSQVSVFYGLATAKADVRTSDKFIDRLLVLAEVLLHAWSRRLAYPRILIGRVGEGAMDAERLDL